MSKNNIPDVLIIGSGFYGAVLAERIANVLNKRVLIIEKRNHIGGNSYSETDKKTNIEYHKYWFFVILSCAALYCRARIGVAPGNPIPTGGRR